MSDKHSPVRPTIPRGLTRHSSALTSTSGIRKYVANIAEMKDIRENDEFSFLENSISSLKKSLSSTTYGIGYIWFVNIMSGISTLHFVYTTYLNPDRQESLVTSAARVELGFALLFVFDWCLNLLVADHPIQHIFGVTSMLDIIIIMSIISVYNISEKSYRDLYNMSDVLIYLIYGLKRLRILRGYRLEYFFQQIADPVKRHLATMALTIFLMIIFWASTVQYLERQFNDYSFHTWMYFTWITLTTVGYGDILARSTLGRIAVMIMIAVAIVYIPKLTNELLEIVSLQSIYTRLVYTPKTRFSEHIVIAGNLVTLHLEEFLEQLFHEDHNNFDLTVVILSPEPPSQEIVFLLKSEKYSLLYLQGSPFFEDDLIRAHVDSARAIFLIANKFSYNVDEEDARIILLNMSLKKHLHMSRAKAYKRFIDKSKKNLTDSKDSEKRKLEELEAKEKFLQPANLFCLQLNRSENRRHLYDDDFHEMIDSDLIICFNEIKLGLMAKSAVIPGIASFLLNLITAFSEDDLALHGKYDENDLDEAIDQRTGKLVKSIWKHEYLAGCEWEIYITTLSEVFNGVPFSKLSSIFYEKFGIILFALQVTDIYHGGYSRVLLFPANYIIPTNRDQFEIELFVIARNQHQADLPSEMFNPSKKKQRRNSSSSQEFKLPEGYVITDKQVVMKIPNENDLPNTDSHDENEGNAFKPNFHAPKKNSEDQKSFESVPSNPDQPQPQQQHHHNRGSADKKISHTRWNKLRRSAFFNTDQNALTYEETLNHLRSKHFLENYFALPIPVDIHTVTIRNNILDEVPGIHDHLIIIGNIALNWYDLIKPLRGKYLGSLRPIVLLYPSQIPSDVWHRIGVFERIYVVKGSPLEEVNLLRAGIFKASQVIILADGSGNHLAEKNFHDEAVDSDAVFAYHFVTRMNPKIKVVLEVINPSNIAYLDRNMEDTKISNYLLSPHFASGILFPTSLLDSIVCQSYYNPHIVKIFGKFITGPEEFNRLDSAIDAAKILIQLGSSARGLSMNRGPQTLSGGVEIPELLKDDSSIRSVESACLYEMKVTADLLKKPFQQVFQELTKKGVLPLAIMRGVLSDTLPGPTGNCSPYVYTNPKQYSELYPCDSLFVLSVTPIIPNISVREKPAAPTSYYNAEVKPDLQPRATFLPSDIEQMKNEIRLTSQSFSQAMPSIPVSPTSGQAIYTGPSLHDTDKLMEEKMRKFATVLNQDMTTKFEQMWQALNQSHQQLSKQIIDSHQQLMAKESSIVYNMPPPGSANKIAPRYGMNYANPAAELSQDDSEFENDRFKVIPEHDPVVREQQLPKSPTGQPRVKDESVEVNDDDLSVASKFVNSEEELLSQQKAYEVKSKPSKRYPAPKAGGPSTAGDLSPSQSSVTGNKKVFGPSSVPIVGPTLHDVNAVHSELRDKIIAKKSKSNARMTNDSRVSSFAFKPRSLPSGSSLRGDYSVVDDGSSFVNSVYDRDDTSVLTMDEDANSFYSKGNQSLGPTTDDVRSFLNKK